MTPVRPILPNTLCRIIIENAATGERQVVEVPLPRDTVIRLFQEAEASADEDGQVEVVAHVGPTRILLRFWSPLPTHQAAPAIAAAIRDFLDAVEVQP